MSTPTDTAAASPYQEPLKKTKGFRELVWKTREGFLPFEKLQEIAMSISPEGNWVDIDSLNYDPKLGERNWNVYRYSTNPEFPGGHRIASFNSLEDAGPFVAFKRTADSMMGYYTYKVCLVWFTSDRGVVYLNAETGEATGSGVQKKEAA